MGDEYTDELVAYGDYSRKSGHDAVLELMERRPDIDGIFVASDLMAAGAITALNTLGRSVPGDVSVAGFDDHALAAQLDPPLTTMRQPFDRIAAEVIRLLLDVIDGREYAAVTVPTQLIERQSV